METRRTTLRKENIFTSTVLSSHHYQQKKLPTKLVVEKTKYKKSNCTDLWLFFFCNSGQSPIEPAGDNPKNYELPRQKTKWGSLLLLLLLRGGLMSLDVLVVGNCSHLKTLIRVPGTFRQILSRLHLLITCWWPNPQQNWHMHTYTHTCLTRGGSFLDYTLTASKRNKTNPHNNTFIIRVSEPNPHTKTFFIINVSATLKNQQYSFRPKTQSQPAVPLPRLPMWKKPKIH